jgi:type VII secretion protein EccB
MQSSAQRFLVRRLEHALVRRDVAMHDDPLRSQTMSFVAGAVLAVIVVAACVVVAVVRPHGTVGSARIVLVRESGALYVLIGETWHPAANLASARLITRSADEPRVVGERALDGIQRGPAVGIPGAPDPVGAPQAWDVWTVCDGADTVVAAGSGSSPADRFDPDRTVLVTPRGEGPALTYLLYEGRRARVDLRETAVVRALRLDRIVPQPVSRALLDTLPEVAPITVPRIEGVGEAGPSAVGEPVGSVVRVLGAAGTEHYVVLTDGMQRIGEVAADVIRFARAESTAVAPTVAPAAVAVTQLVDRLPVADFPAHARPAVGASSHLVCARWHAGTAEAPSTTTVLVGAALPADADTVTLAQADGAGPRVDRVRLPRGRSSYVASTPILGPGGGTGPRHLVTDAGVVSGVRDDAAATALGLPDDPIAAPWPVLAWLPCGPELAIADASVARDALVATPR